VCYAPTLPTKLQAPCCPLGIERQYRDGLCSLYQFYLSEELSVEKRTILGRVFKRHLKERMVRISYGQNNPRKCRSRRASRLHFIFVTQNLPEGLAGNQLPFRRVRHKYMHIIPVAASVKRCGWRQNKSDDIARTLRRTNQL
jgi:hypothetical protein